MAARIGTWNGRHGGSSFLNEVDEARYDILLDLSSAHRSQLVVDQPEVLLVARTDIGDSQRLRVFQRERIADEDVAQVVDGLGEILLRLCFIEENVGILPEFKRLVVVFHTEIIAVDSQVLQHVQSLGMRILQLLVHAERLSELAFLLIEFALYVEQRRVLWL